MTTLISPQNAVLGEYGTTVAMGGATYAGVTFPIILRDYPTYTLIPMTNDSFIQWQGSFNAMENVL
jgi:predicted GTPase